MQWPMAAALESKHRTAMLFPLLMQHLWNQFHDQKLTASKANTKKKQSVVKQHPMSQRISHHRFHRPASPSGDLSFPLHANGENVSGILPDLRARPGTQIVAAQAAVVLRRMGRSQQQVLHQGGCIRELRPKLGHEVLGLG